MTERNMALALEEAKRVVGLIEADSLTEDEKEAITLSFLTTAISFGSLALSSFVPVHVLGLSILTGLSAAFICTIL